MLEELTFGEFITVKRKQSGYTMREFAELITLTPSYLCNIEAGKRPAPAGEIQIMMACVLDLDEDERKTFFDLAAKTKRQGTLPFDISEYVNNDKVIYDFLRKAKEMRLCGSDLLKLL